MRNGGNRSNRKTNRPNAGFTLVEIVLSIAILAIVSLPLLQYFTESLRYSSMMEKRQQAAFLAQQITEGLLAESVLVSRDTESDAYKVPYFDETEWEEAPVMEEGPDDELVITATKDGYKVKVTIDNPGDSENVQDILDYRIDAPENVIYIDTTENTRAVFEFMGLYNSFYSSQTTEPVTEDMISEKMSREMRVGLSQDSGKYHVTLQYVYSCSAVQDENGNPVKWTSEVLMNKAVEDLQNIYLIYDWCDGGDTIIITDSNLDNATEMSLGLYVICQSRNGNKLPTDGSGYEVVVDNNGFVGKIFGYTNLNAGQLKGANGRFVPSETMPSGDTQPAVVYTIHTRVYLENDLLADITTMKGE